MILPLTRVLLRGCAGHLLAQPFCRLAWPPPQAAAAACSVQAAARELQPAAPARWASSSGSSAAGSGSADAPVGASSGGGDSSSSSSSSSSSGGGGGGPDGNAVVDQLDKMMEVMMQNPAMMDMMLSRMPPHMRKPEVVRAMMANPEVRARISALAQQTGMASIIRGMDVGRVSQGMSATLQAGIDPAALMQRFQASPSLAKAMENPRVLTALMDMASNGADALKKYEGDKDVVEAAMEAGDIIQQLQQDQGADSSSGGSSSEALDTTSSSSSSAAVEQQLGAKPEELMQHLMARPDLLAKIQNPQVQQALMEVSRSPWKIVKYLFNKEVMGALKDMKDMLGPGKQ